jgi:hypothetical protein
VIVRFVACKAINLLTPAIINLTAMLTLEVTTGKESLLNLCSLTPPKSVRYVFL